MFKEYLQARFQIEVGNAAKGLDFPSLNTDLKVTSLRQPQSSCPFKAATQKIYGLGYNLLVVVYVKSDNASERAAYLDIQHVIYIDQSRTSDFTLTKQIREIVHAMGSEVGGREIAIEDLDALLQDKNVPLDEVSRRRLAERLVDEPPEQGVLTISNAWQWRLQYGRAISTAAAGSNSPEVVDLRA
ncbi:MAG: hypothetical protein QM597_03450 [Aeromicrobium sp.]